MSAPNVSYKVWNNGRLAACRFDAFVKRAHALCAELNEVAELWQEARRKYGEEFPAWSFGDGVTAVVLVNGLVGSDLAALVEKVQKATYSRVIRSAHGATGTELESVARQVEKLELSKLESVVSDLAERVAKAKGEYARQVTLAKTRKMLQLGASLGAASQLHAADTEAAVSSVEAQEEKAQREERERHRYAEEVSRLLEKLAAEVSHEDRTAIEQRAQEMVESSQASRRRALLAQLRLDVQRVNAAGAARQRRVAQVEQWRQRLLGLEGPEVEELDAALREVEDGQAALPPDMAQKVEDMAARATEASNRAYALGVMTEELEKLGYVVEAGFETASAQAPEMLLHKPEMEEEYHVSLRAEAGAPFLHNRVVREAVDPGLDSQGPRSADRKRTDERMERAWCEDLAAALAAAEHKGVRGRALERLEPGEVPVPTIAPLKSESKPGRKRKRKRTGQMRSRAGR